MSEIKLQNDNNQHKQNKWQLVCGIIPYLMRWYIMSSSKKIDGMNSSLIYKYYYYIIYEK
jgi:hypothetical protein